MQRKVILAGLVAAYLATAGIVLAQPKPNTPRHPNLLAAQQDLAKAWDKILAAQKANEFDLGGHAQKAKELIDQASKELKQAAETANGR